MLIEGWTPLIQSGKLLLGKAPENSVDRLSAHVQITCNRFRIPTIGVQSDN